MSKYSLKLVQTEQDAQHVCNIIIACAKDMLSTYKMDYWATEMDSFTSAQLLHQIATLNSQCYLILQDQQIIVGTFSLCKNVPAYYHDLQFLCSNFIYIKRMAIFPQYQSQGIGSWCLQHVASLPEYASVRLACNARNEKLVLYYTLRGYKPVGIREYKANENAMVFEKVK